MACNGSAIRWSGVAGAVAAVLLCSVGARSVDAQTSPPPADGAPVAASDGRDVPLETLLERGGAYVLRYGESFRNLVAEEAYRQVEYGRDNPLVPQRVRNLRSDVVFVWLAGTLPWATFRDVYDVDGSQVHDRTQRLERLFARPSADARTQALAILAEGSRYNLGRDEVHRNVNGATIALLFLLPQNQSRLVFKRKGRKTIAGFRTVEISFEERTSPTLVRDRGNKEDVAARGSFWIDPVRGTVLRSRIEYDVEKHKRLLPQDLWATILIVTEYRREPGLDIFVPDTMTELYTAQSMRLLEGRASYTSYRRFQVTSEWEVVDTEKPQDETGDAPRP